MSEYGVTDAGFKRKPKSVSVIDLEDSMKANFGQDLDTSAESPEGQIISVISEAVDQLWEVAEHCYNAFNPNAATGVTLENLALINNIKKKSTTKSTVNVTFYGESGTLVQAGAIVKTREEQTGGVSYRFTALTNGTLINGEVKVVAEAEDYGKIQVPIGAIYKLDTPILGITSVTNEEVGYVGRDDETDPELRSRRTSQVALPAIATTDSIVAGLLNIETVLAAKVYENDSADVKDIDGVTINPHGLSIIVQGDKTPEEKEEIAQVIFNRKDPGIQLTGDTGATIKDSQGFNKIIVWRNPILKTFEINIETKVVSSTSLTTNGQEIKDAIIAYINDPITGYKIGDDVSYARLFTPINSIEGHDVQNMTIGFSSGVMSTSDLAITGSELAYITENDIEVTISY